jgi:hypothetical protein
VVRVRKARAELAVVSVVAAVVQENVGIAAIVVTVVPVDQRMDDLK